MEPVLHRELCPNQFAIDSSRKLTPSNLTVWGPPWSHKVTSNQRQSNITALPCCSSQVIDLHHFGWLCCDWHFERGVTLEEPGALLTYHRDGLATGTEWAPKGTGTRGWELVSPPTSCFTVMLPVLMELLGKERWGKAYTRGALLAVRDILLLANFSQHGNHYGKTYWSKIRTFNTPQVLFTGTSAARDPHVKWQNALSAVISIWANVLPPFSQNTNPSARCIRAWLSLPTGPACRLLALQFAFCSCPANSQYTA